MPMKRNYLLLYFAIALPILVSGYKPKFRKVAHNPQEQFWVDSVMQSLSADEKIAQLIMIRSFSGKDRRYYDSIAGVVSKYNIGGICFFKGTPTTQAQAANIYQQAARTPLMVAMDAEWGPGMRLDSCLLFPRQLSLGAIANESLIYEMGQEVGRQLRRMGVHMNFAPVADVNNNALNPVINSRSFGESTQNVTSKSLAYMLGMQDAGVLAVAKHFPGHGDTDSDSHYTLPLIKKPLKDLENIHLPPFKELIDQGVAGVMVAHLAIPSLESDPKTISSLSEKVINNLLVSKMEFDGLVITDGLEMKAITDYVHRDSVEIKALQAGNDILLLPVSVPRAIANIRKAIASGLIPADLINQKCRKVLSFKYRAGLSKTMPVNVLNVIQDINTPDGNFLQRKLIEASFTVVRNEANLLPLMRPDTMKIATLTFGYSQPDIFHHRFDQYARADHYYISSTTANEVALKLAATLSGYDLVVVAGRKSNQNAANNYGFGSQFPAFVNRLAAKTQVVLAIFANPYSLASFKPAEQINTILLAYQDDGLTADLAAQAIFGTFAISGTIPVSIPGLCSAGEGVHIEPVKRLKYTVPEEVGIKQEWLTQADSFALAGISARAYPGCRVLVAIEGKVVYDKAFGNYTYEQVNPVLLDAVYDLASITKIAATTLAIMKLVGESKLDIDKKVSFYLPELHKTNKQNLVIRDVLAHQARLQAWIPFYAKTLKNRQPDSELYRQTGIEKFNIEVAKGLWLHNDYFKTMMDSIAKSPLRDRQQYLYSDLGFFWFKQIIEKQSNLPLDQFVSQNFYKPLGLGDTFYNANKFVSLSRVAPSEIDNEFRMQLVHGYVHDPAAAMMGGVAGHAGLFSTAHDLAVVMQMLLNGGSYGGMNFLKPEIVEQFTHTQFPLNNNRRALGFDKPDLRPNANSGTCRSASADSYGHTGFTGTYAWVDPAFKMVYIFLSNRVYPGAIPNRLSQMNIRQNIHEVFYEALRLRAKQTAMK